MKKPELENVQFFYILRNEYSFFPVYILPLIIMLNIILFQGLSMQTIFMLIKFHFTVPLNCACIYYYSFQKQDKERWSIIIRSCYCMVSKACVLCCIFAFRCKTTKRWIICQQRRQIRQDLQMSISFIILTHPLDPFKLWASINAQSICKGP